MDQFIKRRYRRGSVQARIEHAWSGLAGPTEAHRTESTDLGFYDQIEFTEGLIRGGGPTPIPFVLRPSLPPSGKNLMKRLSRIGMHTRHQSTAS